MLIRQNIELDVPSNGCQVYVKHYLPLEVALGLQNYSVVRMLLAAGCSLLSRHYTCVCDSEDQGRRAVLETFHTVGLLYCKY